MKVSPYMQLNRIEFMVTYQCSGRCRHCSLGDKLNGPAQSKRLPIETAREAIETLARAYDITSVMTFGGEPLLYPDVVCAIHDTARRCGIGSRQLITNGYFTKQPARCVQVAQALGQAGVGSLLLSVDAFHQEHIPLEPVRAFAQAAQAACIPKLRLHPAWVVDREQENPYNRKTREILETLGDLGIPVSSGNEIFMAGNAVRYLAEYYPQPALDLRDTCGSMPYTQPLTNLTSLTIGPQGDVMVCDFIIGNLFEESMEEIVARYDPYQNQWMRAVLSGGAKALLELAKQTGKSVDPSQCYSVCDLCRKLTGAG